jgi:hypothetical protein
MVFGLLPLGLSLGSVNLTYEGRPSEELLKKLELGGPYTGYHLFSGDSGLLLLEQRDLTLTELKEPLVQGESYSISNIVLQDRARLVDAND